MTMDAQRRARAVEFLQSFSDDVLQEAAHELEASGQPPGTPFDPRHPLHGALVEGLSEPAPKSSTDSLVERVRALEDYLRRAVPIFQIEARWGGCKTCDPGNEGGEIFSEMLAEAKTLLDGPPDPERDRESRADVERPDVSTEEDGQ